MFQKKTVSNTLILLSVITTLIAYRYPGIYTFGMNDFFLSEGLYHYYFIQFFSSNFLHGGILHLAMNGIFIYLFGNIVEIILGKKKYILFFLFTIFFNGILLSIFASDQNTIGISGFALAILTYYTLELRSKKNPDYKGGVTAIIINIGIGLYPGISLFGHLFGVIAGLIFYFLNHNFFGKQEVGFTNNLKNYLKKKPELNAELLKKEL